MVAGLVRLGVCKDDASAQRTDRVVAMGHSSPLQRSHFFVGRGHLRRQPCGVGVGAQSSTELISWGACAATVGAREQGRVFSGMQLHLAGIFADRFFDGKLGVRESPAGAS